MKKKVCVIGAGPSGLAIIKELMEEGIEVKCFETFDSIGGAFRSIAKGGRSYDSLRLTVSNYFMAYSDYMPKIGSDRTYWSVAEYRDYLLEYVEHFKLSDNIFLSHEVVSSTIEGDRVIMKIIHQGKEFTEEFDHLIICTGSNYIPKSPKIPDEDKFEGTIYHSSQYINAEEFKDKNVVCIGLGESGADVVHEIGQVANNCEVLVRDYPNVIPRWINGYTNDSYTAPLLYALKKKGIDSYMQLKAWYYLKFNKELDDAGRLIQEWVADRDSFMGKFFTKTDVFVNDILEGNIKLNKDKTKHFTRTGIVTEKRNEIKADVIVYNTGYQTTFKEYSFGESFENPRALFKHMIHPEFGDRIGLIGWARPSQGGLPACSEMQARYMAHIISGKLELPTQSEMESTIIKDEIYNEKLFADSTHIRSLICYYKFMNDMGDLIGCKPKKIHLNDLPLTKKLIFGSHISAIYRLNENPDAKEVIKSLPIAFSNRRMAVLMLFAVLFYPFYLKNGV